MYLLKVLEYPEELNPFGSEDEAEKDGKNPFEEDENTSSSDEEERNSEEAVVGVNSLKNCEKGAGKEEREDTPSQPMVHIVQQQKVADGGKPMGTEQQKADEDLSVATKTAVDEVVISHYRVGKK